MPEQLRANDQGRLRATLAVLVVAALSSGFSPALRAAGSASKDLAAGSCSSA